MKPKTIAILHFNMIEQYPPVMNFIFDKLEDNPELRILVLTTNNTANYKTPTFPNTKIYRFGTISINPLKRYTSYLWFNFMSSLILLSKKFDLIIAFESLSIFPLWLRTNIRFKTKAHLHFHEYISLLECQISSTYMKILFKLEDQLLRKHKCSHTNEDRKRLFLKDKPFLKSENVEVRPNMPPKSWWNQYGQLKKPNTGGKIRLVHVGAADHKTMYIKEVLEWAKENSKKIELTFISQQLEKETKHLILNYCCSSISIMNPIDYYELPKELIKYDIGLVLYNGYIPNHIYSVPNKVYEYLACGLQVWYSKDLLTTDKLNNNSNQIENDIFLPPSFLKILYFNNYYFQEKIFVNKLIDSV
jgi:hypothetical protein